MKKIPSRSLAGRVFRCATVLTVAATLVQPLALAARPAATRLQPGPISPSPAATNVRPNVPAAAPVVEGLPNFDVRYSKLEDAIAVERDADPGHLGARTEIAGVEVARGQGEGVRGVASRGALHRGGEHPGGGRGGHPLATIIEEGHIGATLTESGGCR